MNRQANMAGLSPLTVVSWNEFVADPTVMYNLFWRNPQTGQFQFDPQYVSVMAGTNSRVLKVSTVEELTRLEQELMSKPILLDVSTQYSKTENYVVVRVTTTWRGSFAVLLNPLHPMVRQPMEEMFRKGVDLIASGKKFCLEFDLGSCMEAWYADMLGSTNGCYDRSKSANTRFYITNSSKYQHCFDCNPWWFVFGFSCWLLSAPFYLIHRACTVDDSLLNFNLPVVMRTPLSQNRALEIHPSNNYDQAAANRQVLMNRANQQQSFHDPEVYAPDGGAYRGGPPPPGVSPVNPPPYSPPPYQPQQDPNSSAVVQQPGRPATAPDENIV